ncbi:MAG: hypothetical protein ABIJ46_02510 [bacterium]
MTGADLLRSVRRSEWLVVAAVAAMSTVLVSLPPLLGWFEGMWCGQEWTGLGLFSPGDFGVYLSYIRQATGGSSPWLANQFTVAVVAPTLNPFWWLVGRLAAFLSVGPVAGFYLMRTLLVPVLAAVSYLTIAALLDRRAERLAAFLLLAFGSGWGYLFALLPPSGSVWINWPIDLWVAESNLFASELHSPHFVASWIMFLLTVLLLVLGFRSGRWCYHLTAGLSAAALFSFHPFHAPTLYVLGLVGLLVWGGGWGRPLLRRGLRLLPFYLLSLPVVASHYLTLTGEAAAREITAANLTPTPGWPYLLLGFGLVLVLAPFGWWLLDRRAPRRAAFLLGWVAAQLVLVYLPFAFQRRLLEGLQFPLVVLAGVAAVGALRLFRAKELKPRLVATMTLIGLLSTLPSSVYVWASSLRVARGETSVQAFFPPAESMVLNWVRESSPADASFVSVGTSGYFIAGWGERPVLFGHWVNSGDVTLRQAEVQTFFAELNDVERAEFMRARGLTHVYIGPAEQLLLSAPLSDEIFARVYAGGGIEVYELRDNDRS